MQEHAHNLAKLFPPAIDRQSLLASLILTLCEIFAGSIALYVLATSLLFFLFSISSCVVFALSFSSTYLSFALNLATVLDARSIFLMTGRVLWGVDASNGPFRSKLSSAGVLFRLSLFVSISCLLFFSFPKEFSVSLNEDVGVSSRSACSCFFFSVIFCRFFLPNFLLSHAVYL